MSKTGPVSAAAGAPAAERDVRAAIARAAATTGVDFNYLLAQAKLESGLDPGARARTSSAAGLYQFTNGTWLNTVDRHGGARGLGWADAAIDDGRVRDPAIREQILALRFDPSASALMAAELASDNRAALTQRLGRAPDSTELYMAHFLGADGAGRFLSALANDPAQSAAALLPAAAAANRGIFYAGGAPRSVGEVMEAMRGKVARAGETDDGTAAQWAEGYAPDAPQAAAWTASAAPALANPAPARPSMAETLHAAFALGNSDNSQGGAQVRAAYGKLRAFGL